MAERKLRLEVLQGDEEGEYGVSRVPRWQPTGQDAIITNDITGSVMKIMVTDSRGKLISIIIGKNGTIQEVKDEQTERSEASIPQDGTVMNWENIPDDSTENNQQGGLSSQVAVDDSCNVDLSLVKEEMEVEEPESSGQPFADVLGMVSEGYDDLADLDRAVEGHKHMETLDANVEDKQESEMIEKIKTETEDMSMAGQFETVFIEPSMVTETEETTHASDQNSELSNFIFGSHDQGIGIPVFCRLCATRNEDMVDIFGLDEVYRNIIDDFLPVTVKTTDYLPKQACRSCVEKLEQCQSFHETVAEAQNQFLILEEKIHCEFKSLKNYPQVSPQCNGQLQAPNENSEELEFVPKPSLSLPSKGNGRLTRAMRKIADEDEVETPANLKPEADIVKCRICGRFFGTPKSCYVHSKVHALNGYVPCSMCNKIFTNRKDAHDHSMDHILPLTTHKMRDMMKKKISDLKLNDVKSVKGVVNVIEENRKREADAIKNSGIKCRICGALFSNPRSCYKHSIVHAAGNYHPCCMCDKTFTSKTAALVHSLEHITDCSTPGAKTAPVMTTKNTGTAKKKPPEFDLDNYLSTRSGKLFNNIEQKGEKDDCDMVKCRLCGMFFGTGKSCYAHSAIHNSKDYYPCSMCNVSFTNKEDSFSHSIKHTMTKFQQRRAKMMRERCYIDPVIPATRIINVETDNVVENCERPVISTEPGPDDDLVKCRLCGMYFGTAKSCYRHSASHNSKDYYPCSMCEEIFVTHKDSYNHSVKHTLTKPPQRRAEMFRQHGFIDSPATLPTRSINVEKDSVNEINEEQTSAESDDLVKCRFCALVFGSVLECYKHARAHYLRGKYPCCMCNKTFATQGESYVHSLSHRTITVRNVGNAIEQRKKYACNIAREREYIPDQDSGNDGWIQCSVCTIFCESAASFVSHCCSHISTNDFPCCICNETFETEADYCLHSKKHLSDSLQEGKVSIPICSICGKRFPTTDRLKFHKIYHDPKTKPRFCRKCDQHFASESSLYEHIHAVHIEPPEKFECKKCRKQFGSRQQLTAHLPAHKKPMFECPACNSRFHSAERLKSHKLFSCSFSKTQKLKNHTCAQCGKTFLRKNSLIIHEQSHTDQSRQDRDEAAGDSKLKCSKCEQSFSNMTELRKHAMLHIANKQFSCYGCNKSFKTDEARKEHIRTTHMDETHDCDICGEKLMRPSLLEKHKRLWHGHVTK